MIVGRLVQRIDVGEVGLRVVRAVVSDDVEHHPDVSSVGSIDELVEVCRATELGRHLFPVERTVAMVIVRDFILRNRRNPNGIEAHACDVIEMLCDALESAAAVMGEVGTLGGYTVNSSEAICKHLINGAALPLGGSLRCGNASNRCLHKRLDHI